MWWLGVLGLLALVVYRPNPILILILLLSASEIWHRWQLRKLPQAQDYYRVAPHRRLGDRGRHSALPPRLVFGMHATHVDRACSRSGRPPGPRPPRRRPRASTSARIASEFREGFEAVERIAGPRCRSSAPRGSAEDHPAYVEARDVARLLAEAGFAIVTGGGPGVMEAANRGAREGGGLSVGFNIELPHEQHANPYLDITSRSATSTRARRCS